MQAHWEDCKKKRLVANITHMIGRNTREKPSELRSRLSVCRNWGSIQNPKCCFYNRQFLMSLNPLCAFPLGVKTVRFFWKYERTIWNARVRQERLDACGLSPSGYSPLCAFQSVCAAFASDGVACGRPPRTAWRWESSSEGGDGRPWTGGQWSEVTVAQRSFLCNEIPFFNSFAWLCDKYFDLTYHIDI